MYAHLLTQIVIVHTLIPIKITFDPNKDFINQKKHGISLELAESLEWETLVVTEDTRNDYGESRMIGYAILRDRLYCVIYTDRGDARRIISLRKANNREINRYERICND